MPRVRPANEPAKPAEPPRSIVEVRDELLDRIQMKHPKGETAEWNRVVHREPAAEEARKVIRRTSVEERKRVDKEVSARKTKRFNSLLTLKVVWHAAPTADGDTQPERTFLMETQDSVYLPELTRLVQQRLGVTCKLRLLWLSKSGETIALDSQRVLERFADREWCSQPWVLHAHEDTKAATQALALTDSAKALFDRYDVNNNGRIDRRELCCVQADSAVYPT